MALAGVNHDARRSVVAAALPDDLDGLLVTAADNVRYLTGFSGSHGAVLLDRAGRGVLATDGRYLERAATEAPGIECLDIRRAGPALVAHAKRLGIARLGYEPASVTVAALDGLVAAADGLELIRAPRVVEAQRVVKDQAEIAAIAKACEITVDAFHLVIGELKPGVSERDVARRLVGAMQDRGASGPAFDAIVAFGPHSAIPHHEPTDRPLSRGDLVKLDFGAAYEGYCADMTRTVVVGTAADWQREIHGSVEQLQAELRGAAVRGAMPRRLDAAMRERLGALDHAPLHGLGHGVGLAIHEDPFLTEASPAPALRAGAVITIEPGIYLSGRGGVRIEDTLVVQESGEPRVLTDTTRELIQV
jgi:Xaa-Pro aminopeptidase